MCHMVWTEGSGLVLPALHVVRPIESGSSFKRSAGASLWAEPAVGSDSGKRPRRLHLQPFVTCRVSDLLSNCTRCQYVVLVNVGWTPAEKIFGPHQNVAAPQLIVVLSL